MDLIMVTAAALVCVVLVGMSLDALGGEWRNGMHARFTAIVVAAVALFSALLAGIYLAAYVFVRVL